MLRVAMIQNGIVQNIAKWDGVTPWNPVGYTLVDVSNTPCDIGWVYENGAFSPPAEE